METIKIRQKIKEWNNFWIGMAEHTSTLSKDPSTKVGSVIVTMDNRQCSLGFNGFARGIAETEAMWNNRELKLEMVIHSEQNALLNCPFQTRGCKIYVTHQPCHRCLIHLINAGIREVYYKHSYDRLGHKVIWDAHVKLFDVVEQII